jgi:hypothetical protein
VVAECTLKESAAINQILGRRVSGDQQVPHSVLHSNVPPLSVNCNLWWYIGGGSESVLILHSLPIYKDANYEIRTYY